MLNLNISFPPPAELVVGSLLILPVEAFFRVYKSRNPKRAGQLRYSTCRERTLSAMAALCEDYMHNRYLYTRTNRDIMAAYAILELSYGEVLDLSPSRPSSPTSSVTSNDSSSSSCNSTEDSDSYRGKRKCPDCGKLFASSSNLSRHRQTHKALTSETAKQCHMCDKMYVSMPALAMHLQTHYRKFKCEVCEKTFSRSWLLQNHMRLHTGEKPFECNTCGKKFSDKSNLRVHSKTHKRKLQAC